MSETKLHEAILYAEDNRWVRSAVAEMLEEEGWTVEACADGLAALALIEGGARYGLLLFDRDLPGLSGLELAARARLLPHRAALPVVIISAGGGEREALRAGADAFLRKPEDVPRLAGVLRRLLDAR